MTSTITNVTTEQNITQVITEQNITNITTEQNATTIVTIGSQGPPGIAGINWLGDYSDTTAYSARDGVAYQGSAYYCTSDTTGNTPTETSYWGLLAQAGDSSSIDYFTASETISGFKVVKENSDGTIAQADKDQSDYGVSIIGVATTSGSAGDTIKVMRIGRIVDSSLNLTIGPLFLGSNGDITSFVPTSGIVLCLGSAINVGIAEIFLRPLIIRN